MEEMHISSLIEINNQLLYCDGVECEAVKLARKIPVITMWTTDDLENREMEEIIYGDFGFGKVAEDEEGPSIRFNTIEEQTTSIEEYEEKFEGLTKEFIKRMKELFTKYDNVLEVGGSWNVGNQENLNEGGGDDTNDVHDV
ncbi:hypothetical protein L2E82_50587 [Cichorium intybus]|nr:hypothetical protein L2E82_50587 [Cichorium intybus]